MGFFHLVMKEETELDSVLGQAVSVGLPGLGLAGSRDLGFGFREMVGFPAPIG